MKAFHNTNLAIIGGLLLLQLLFSIKTKAQNYPETSYASIDDTLYYTSASLSNNLPLDSMGSNITLDFRSLVGVSQNSRNYRSPRNAGISIALWPYIYNVNNVNLSSTTNQANYLGSLTLDNYNSFYKNTTSLLEEKATSYDINIQGRSIPVRNQFTSSDVIYRFPLTTTTLDSSTSSYTTSVPQTYYQNHIQKRKNIGSGSGTVITPYGTFPNSVQLITEFTVYDSIALLTIPLPSIEQNYRLIQWFNSSLKDAIITIRQQKIGAIYSTTSIVYLDSIRYYTPNALFAFFPAIPAVGDTVQMQNLSINASTYLWNFDDPASGALNTSTLANPSHIFNQIGDYNITLVTYNGPYTDTLTLPISVTSTVLPTAGFTISSDTICQGNRLTVTGSALNAYSTIWYFEGGTPQSWIGTEPPQILYSNTGSFSITQIVRNNNGVDTLTTMINVNGNAQPELQVINDTIYAQNSVNSELYNWYYENNLIASTSNSYLLRSTFGYGKYSCVAMSTFGCLSEESDELCIMPPTPTISGTTTFCTGNSTVLTSIATSGNIWSNGATSQSITVNNSGSYSVRLISGSCLTGSSNVLVVSAVTCENIFIGNGNYNVGSNWLSGTVPIQGRYIKVSGNMTLNQSVIYSNVTLLPNATVSIGSGFTLTVTDTLNNRGIISGNGTLKLAGANNQVFGGGTIANILFNNLNTIVQNQPTKISGSITLGFSQVLNLNNMALTLLSEQAGSAYLATVPRTSSIINSRNFTVQRWLNSANIRNGSTNSGNYYLLGPIVQDQTLNLWNAASPYNNATFAANTRIGNLYLYNPITNNWYKPSSSTDNLSSGAGVQVWFGTNSFFGQRNYWQAVGNPIVGDYNLPLTNQAGFHLLSNPYPSTIDWDSPNWTKSGVANAIYIYDWVNQRYRTYVNGIGTNGGNRYLPTAQGFFVNATTTSPVLTTTENIKVTNQVALQRAESTVNGIIRIQIIDGTVTDEMVIANSPAATTVFEFDKDAQKMMNPTTNIFVNGAVNQSIASMNLNGVNSIPFVIQTSTSGLVSLISTELSGLEGYTFNLFNEQTGELLPYTGSETYTFNVSANQPYRLQLRVGSVTSIGNFEANVFEVFPNPATDKITIKTTGKGTLEILNTLGQVVITQMATGTNEINIAKLAKGVYSVRFNGVSQKLVVK
jgi:hypothetical protein